MKGLFDEGVETQRLRTSALACIGLVTNSLHLVLRLISRSHLFSEEFALAGNITCTTEMNI